MDGKTLSIEVRNILQESSTSTFLDDRATYDYLYKGVLATILRTFGLTASQSITTVASTTTYALNSNFLKLYMRDTQNNLFVKYYDGTSYTMIPFKTYEHIYLANNTTAVTIPSSFTIQEAAEQTRLSGTSTSTSAGANGEAVLNDTGAGFTTTVTVGDVIHNVTDGSSGYVISVASNTAITTALFNGTLNYWTSGDSYMIFPQARYQLILDPLPSTSGHVITVPYVMKPAPVYSPYRSYNLPVEYIEPIVSYAAWKYKYRDREPVFGDMLYRAWDMQTRELARVSNTVRQNKSIKVSFSKTAFRDRTRR